MVVALLAVLQAGTPAAIPAPAFDAIVRGGMERRVYPGAALVIGTRDTILFAQGYGRLSWSANSPAVSIDSTLWDLASLTKVIATTPALMLLVERGAVALDSAVARYIPEFARPATRAISVRQLLTHTSGLRGTLPLREAADSAAALRMVLTTTPVAPPGSRMVYSDVNAILLGEIVRRVSGVSLDAFAAREVFGPLGMNGEMMFRPPRAVQRSGRIAPSGVWRGHAIAGVVNDPNAAKLGGVAGHAGLFGTAAAVARFAQFMLAEGTAPNGGPRLLQPATVQAFTRVTVPARRGASARTLGWEAVPTGERVSSAGTLLGPRSYGHTGWTGTSLWIDPDRGLFVLLLTNRSYARAFARTAGSFEALKEVRGHLADAAVRAADASGP